MSRTLKAASIIAATFAIALYGAFVYTTQIVSAQPSRLQAPSACKTAAATTTLSYMTPGNSTTTVTCNMAAAGEGTEVFDSAIVLLDGTASSTATTVNVNLEWSMDGVDWYQDTLTIGATTTSPIGLNTASSFHYLFASSTIGQQRAGTGQPPAGGGGSRGDRFARAFSIPVEAQYVRVIMTNTGAGVGVWASIIGKTEKTY